MPSSSTITSSDKSKVKSSIPSSANKIITATVGRVYAAYPSPSKWSFIGIEGAIAFVRDLNKATFYFKVVDLKGTRGVIWEHELYDGFQYNQDRTFFHSFEGDDCLVGFSFADESEAGDFFKKVTNRAKYAKSKSSGSSGPGTKKKSKAGGSGKIDKSMISAPSGFQHVAHMGFTAEHGFSSENVDPSWQALLDQLSSMGVSERDIRKNEGFIKDFVGKRGGPKSIPPAPKAKKVPPPAPTSKRKAPPPPPAPRTRPGSSVAPPPASTSSPAAAAAPQPPPPPARGGGSAPPPPPPPPPPARGGGMSAPPPPPPPPPTRPGASGGAAPPPPPPPPPPPLGGGSAGGAPPPPPPPPPAAGLPPPQTGRGNLLASIQGKGVHSLKKVDPNAPTSAAARGGGMMAAGAAVGTAAAVASHDDEANEAGASGDPADLASALAAALSQRKGNMGESDEEESDDDW
ncbi:WH1-domain-containing protein [Violaceomyces palustris]|uniref:WH1-domain-containing protein n=1 Tax=Violaceomyces palustris TaxID=1673888 RepID=A0ACD0NSM5_9BASI|nr:WH1-domain-containing protein [Violaceomyces palustris]